MRPAKDVIDWDRGIGTGSLPGEEGQGDGSSVTLDCGKVAQQVVPAKEADVERNMTLVQAGAMPPEVSAVCSRSRIRATHQVLIVATLLAVSLYSLCGCGSDSATKPILRIYAGAGLRRAMDELAERFHRETGIASEIDYGGSGIIISRAKEDDDADLFIPGDVWYVDRLQELTGNIRDKTTVSYFVPTIIVQKGNPKQVRHVADLARDDLSLALGNPEACQIGRLSEKILANAGLNPKTIPAKLSLTVNELAVWVKMKDADAAIVWDAIAANVADAVDAVEISKGINEISVVVAGLMASARHPEEARKFIGFMTGEAGQKILNRNGYRTQRP